MGIRELRAGAIDRYLSAERNALGRRMHSVVYAAWQRRPPLHAFLQIDDPASYLLAQALERALPQLPRLQVTLVGPPHAAVDPAPQRRRSHALRDAAELAHQHQLAFPDAPQRPGRGQIFIANSIMLVERDAAGQLDAFRHVAEALWTNDLTTLQHLARRLGRVPADRVGLSLEAGDRRLTTVGHYMPATTSYCGEHFQGVERMACLHAALGRHGYPPASFQVRQAELPAGVNADSQVLEFYFSFRSPFSYLAVERLRASPLASRQPIEVKAVLPMVMRGLAVPLRKQLYLARDAAREARRLGIPFGRLMDPLGPAIGRCMALLAMCQACSPERVLPLLSSIGRGIWAEARDIRRDDELLLLCERAGLERALCRQVLPPSTWQWQGRAEQSRADLAALGLWGVPSFRLGRFVTWGQDRVEHLIAALAEGRT